MVSVGVMVITSLSFSLLLLSVLNDNPTDKPGPLVRTVKLRPDRSILDVHYTNVINVEKEPKESKFCSYRRVLV